MTSYYYLDGKEELKLVRPSPIQTNGGTETETGKAGDGGFAGLIDEVTIYYRHSLKKRCNKTAVNPIAKLTTHWARIKVLR